MGFFYWGDPKPRQDAEYHEEVHRRAYKGERIPGSRWSKRDGQPVMEGRVPSGKDGPTRAAVALYAGYLAGGGDDEDDRKAAQDLAREAGVSMREIDRRARRYL